MAMREIVQNGVCIWTYKGKRVYTPGNVAANGFENGHTATRILEMDEGIGSIRDIHYLVEYKEVDFLEFIPRKVANERIPQLVIQFLRKRLVFRGSPNREH